MLTYIKILRGYVFDRFLSGWTLLIKALGLALAVASGLSLGKEVKWRQFVCPNHLIDVLTVSLPNSVMNHLASTQPTLPDLESATASLTDTSV